MKNNQEFSAASSVAIFLLSLKDEDMKRILSYFSPLEVKKISQWMASLGFVEENIVQNVRDAFIHDYVHGSGLMGSAPLTQTLFQPNSAQETEDSLWDVVQNSDVEKLWQWLRKENISTIAYILSQLTSKLTAQLIDKCPLTQATQVLHALDQPLSLSAEVKKTIEESIREAFVHDTSNGPGFKLETIFEHLSHKKQEDLFNTMKKAYPKQAAHIQNIIFTFKDFGLFKDHRGISLIIRHADKENLAKALSRAPSAIQDVFFQAMSDRAKKLLQDDMQLMQTLSLQEQEKAQASLIEVAKTLEAQGHITLPQRHSL